MKKRVVLFVLLSFTSVFSQVKEYYITCNTDDFEMIYNNFLDDIYIPVKISYNGEEWTDTEMRIRGETTRYGPKKSLKIQFESEPFYNGKYTINLNADYQDQSYLHSVLASMVFRKAGVPCFEAEHIRVYLNGSFLGLYVQIENMDSQFLEKFNFKESGNLYKAAKDAACLSLYDNIDSLWEKKTNESTDKTDLKTLIEKLNITPDSIFQSTCKSIFDYDNLITFLALNMLLANGSTYYHNYYVFHEFGLSNKWLCFPWDMDKTFNTYSAGWHYGATGAWLFPANPLIERALLDTVMFQDLKNKLTELRDDFFNEQTFYPIIDSLAIEIEQSVSEDSTDDIGDDLNDWKGSVQYTKNFIRDRYNSLNWQFSHYPLPFKMNKVEKLYTHNSILSWQKAKSPQNKEISYTVFIGRSPEESSKSTYKIENIKDTFFVLSDYQNGIYYFKVTAWEGDNFQEAYDRYNKFELKDGTNLPCSISKDMTLTKEDSPYIADCSVIVNPGVKLTIEQGAVIHINGFYNFEIRGEITANGTVEEPIVFKPFTGISKFREFYMFEPTGLCTFKNVEFYNCNIKALNGVYKFDGIKIYINDTSITDDAIYAEDAIFSIENSEIYANGISEGVIVFTSDKPVIQNCLAVNTADSYQFVQCTNGAIKNNISIGATDDGIDHNGCKNTVISGNTVINPKDKGVSVGDDSWGKCENIELSRNIIVSASVGMELKDGSTVSVLNNTLYNNKIGIHGYEKVANTGGSIVDIRNTIIYGSEQDIFSEDNSQLSINYSLSNTTLHEGVGNILANPLFKDTIQNNFNLLNNSPCIDAGDPDSPLDPDGSRADLGALYFNQSKPKIVINEINYNSSPDYNSGDWVELYNNENYDVDISNWVFKDSDDSHGFTFPKNTILTRSGFIVLCEDSLKFKNVFKNATAILGNLGFGLSGSGEIIRLFDNYNKLIDSVRYDDMSPWNELADGKGHSLELINPNLDNSLAENWIASEGLGSPSVSNDSAFDIDDDTLMSFDIINIFPNPAKNYLIIDLMNWKRSSIDISICDITGRVYECHFALISYKDNNGVFYVALNGFAEGIYNVILTSNNQSIVRSFVLLK